MRSTVTAGLVALIGLAVGGLAPARDLDGEARAALALALALETVPPAEPVVAEPTYKDLYRQSLAEGKPLLVWVGQKCPGGDYGEVLHLEAATWPGAAAPCCVVSVPDQDAGELWRLRDLPGVPSPGEVQAVIASWTRARVPTGLGNALRESFPLAGRPAAPFSTRGGRGPC